MLLPTYSVSFGILVTGNTLLSPIFLLYNVRTELGYRYVLVLSFVGYSECKLLIHDGVVQRRKLAIVTGGERKRGGSLNARTEH